MRTFLFLLAFLPTLLHAQNKVFRLRALEYSEQEVKTITAKTVAKWTPDSTTLIVIDFTDKVFRITNAEGRTESFAWTRETKVKNHSPESVATIWEYQCVDARGYPLQVQLTCMRPGYEEHAIVVLFYSDWRLGWTARLVE